jgi:hypothetical protein
MRRLLLAAIVAMALAIPSTASANWGPYANCNQGNHCYGLTERAAGNLSIIDDQNNLYTTVSDGGVYGGPFVTNEEWASEHLGPYAWVEVGQLMGWNDCCTAYPFYAIQDKSGWFFVELAPGPVASGAGQYNYSMIWDAYHNGCWYAYWSGATNTWNPFPVGMNCGKGVYITEQEDGMEASDNTEPSHRGRDGVMASEGRTSGNPPSEWFLWTGAQYNHDPGICVGPNPELGNPPPVGGNHEWVVNGHGCY